MEFRQNWPKTGLLFIYLAVAAIIFLIGMVCGRFVLNPSVPPAPAVSFVTLPAVPTTADQAAVLPGETPCSPAAPAGWVAYIIQPGDTLSGLAARLSVSQGRILRANCLTSPDDLQAGQTLFLPTLLTPTPCAPSPPVGWSLYTVQSGDTLSSLASARAVATAEVIQINCLTSVDLIEGQSLYLPTLPIPTPCAVSPPAGWTLYTVQSGDTLFSLAAARGSTTAEVLRVNCLALPDIKVGDALYLPALPTPFPTQPAPVPPPTPALTTAALAPALPPAAGSAPPGAAAQGPSGLAVDSRFGNRRGNLPEFSLSPPSPNAPEVACDETDKPEDYQPGGPLAGRPWISAPWLNFSTTPSNERAYFLRQGQRAYFFACDFPDPAAYPSQSVALTASINSDKDPTPWPLKVSFYIPPNEEQRVGKKAQGAVVWNALCDQPTGTYTITIKFGQDNRPENQAKFAFTLEEARTASILTIPAAGPPGTNFQVYYCKFDPDLKKVKIDLFYEAARRPTDSDRVLWRHADSWDVPIPPSGWTTKSLPSSTSDPGVAYMVGYKSNDVLDMPDVADTIWLLR